MNTKVNDGVSAFGSASVEAEKLKSEIEVGKSIVDSARNRYAEELGDNNAISKMRKLASIQPKTYKIPRKARRDGRLSAFLRKIKIILGIEEK